MRSDQAQDHFASGSTSRLFSAADPASGREIALKVFDPGQSEFPAERFVAEFELLRRESVPGLVHARHLLPQRPAFTMEMLPAETLASKAAVLRRDARSLAGAAAHALLALARLHRAGWVHGDLKPECVYLVSGGPAARDGRVVLADLGLAKSFGSQWPRLLEGTPAYMAPECMHELTVDGRSDLYALGMIVLEILAGEHPASDAGLEATLARHLDRNMADEAHAQHWLKFLGGLLARDRRERFGTAEEALGVLFGEALVSTADLRRAALAAADDEPRWIARSPVDGALDRFVASARTRPGLEIRVRGPSGSGLTRTLAELATRWELAGGTTVPVNATRQVPLAEALGAAIARTAALVESPAPPLEDGSPKVLADAFARLPHPVLVVVDGAPDPGDLAALRDAAFARGAPVSWAWVAPEATATRGGTTAVSLKPWTQADLGILFETLSGSPVESVTLTSWILARSGGLPQLAALAVRSLLESEAAAFSPQGWTIDLGRLGALETPHGLSDWAHRRIEGLALGAREALECYALLGPSSDALAAAALGRPLEAPREGEPDPGAAVAPFLLSDGSRRWIAQTDLARALSEAIDSPRAGEIVARARTYLDEHAREDRTGAQRARIAAAAGLPAAAEEIAAASRRLLEAGEPARALECARTRVAGASPALEAEISCHQARAFLILGACDDARVAARAALASKALLPRLRFECERVRAGAAGRQSRREEAIAAYRASLGWLEPEDEADRATVEIEIAVHLSECGRLDEAETTLRDVLQRLGRRTLALRQRARAERALGLVAHRRGDWALAEAAIERALNLSRELGDPREIAGDELNLASICGNRSRYAAASGHLDEAAKCLETLPHLGQISTLAMLRAHVFFARCGWDNARDSVRRARRGFGCLGRWVDHGRATVLEAEIAVEMRDLDAPRRAIERVVRRGALEPVDPGAMHRAWTAAYFAALGTGSSQARLRALSRAKRTAERAHTRAETARQCLLEAWEAHLNDRGEELRAAVRRFDAASPDADSSTLRAGTEIAALAAAHGIKAGIIATEADEDRIRLLARFAEALLRWSAAEGEQAVSAALDEALEKRVLLQGARCAELALARASRFPAEAGIHVKAWQRRAAKAWSMAGGSARAWEIAGSLTDPDADPDRRGNSRAILDDVIPAAAELLAASEDRRAVADGILALAVRALEARRGVLLLIDADGELRQAARFNADESLTEDILPISRTVVDGVLGRGRAFLSRDAAADLSLRKKKSVIRLAIRSVICAPLRRGDETIGAIYLDTDERPGAFAEAEAELLQRVGALAVAALELAEHRAAMEERAQRLADEVRSFRRGRGLPQASASFVCRSGAMQRVVALARQAAATDANVLIEGETGVGKTALARLIHHMSRRSEGPCLILSLPELSESLIETELFGHEKGAFTGASALKHGLFETAAGGTLVLDEIGDLSARLQPKLLRVVGEGYFRRVGGTRDIPFEGRLICATNRDLMHEVQEGRFRMDLYSRISTVPVLVPPLRERQEDIPELIDLFLRHYFQRHRRKPFALAAPVIERLCRAQWAGGNIRDLSHTIERIVIFERAGRIPEECFPEDAPPLGLSRPHSKGPTALKGLIQQRDELEKVLLQEALSRHAWNRTRASRDLKISDRMVRYLIRKHGLQETPE